MAPPQGFLGLWLCALAFSQHGLSTLIRTPTPPMGWNSYNYYSCYPNETIIKSNAKGLVDLGLASKGYTTVTTDCGWSSRNRTSGGQIAWNETLFPSGFPSLGEYIHGLGLKFGLYSGGGVWECDPDNGAWHLQASLGHEVEDATTFASWGGDSLKYVNPSVRFAAMANALQATNRSFVYDICQWGVGQDLGVWAPRYGDTWRISNDIQNNWASIWRITNEVVPYWKHTGVGKYADMDMLIVGLNVLSFEEERFHFSMWAISKSPLVIGAPMDTSLIPEESLDILANEDVIAINQDALGEQARLIRRYTEEEYDIWVSNLTSGRKLLAITNWANSSANITVDTRIIGVASADKIKDVWAATETTLNSSILSLSLVGHEAKLLILSNITAAQQAPQKSAYYPATSALLSGSATLIPCSNKTCLPTHSKIANLTNSSSVTFSNITFPSTNPTKLIAIDYINYDTALDSAWSNGTNTRNLTLSVNGGEAKRWAFPISGGNWWETGRLDVEVDGFVEGANVVVVGTEGPGDGAEVVGLEVFG
ncbi:carbohydrate-binding module family 35 protein [Saccharata proteae CBS 121410]|uniref:Alpha-galactosidase n=1 Tax=Saccharata proteae CBS 121410 TaxID=1314787 RepID=A0A9P4HSN3_9PEZI|nr:carbohydrate-binding module family 35 protein [Saccharata proteae CBS 121410]